ncbi:MAG: peptidase, partial [Rhodobacteraceae bacterium]|nr:peptidase [Paracoccaceae bacterium]
MTFHLLRASTIALSAGLASSAMAADKADVLTTYADIAAAKYADSLTTAKALQSAVDALIADPSDLTL